MPDDMTSRAASILASILPEKTRIQVSSSDAPATARAVQRCMADAGRVFERGQPVKLKRDQLTGTMRALLQGFHAHIRYSL